MVKKGPDFEPGAPSELTFTVASKEFLLSHHEAMMEIGRTTITAEDQDAAISELLNRNAHVVDAAFEGDPRQKASASLMFYAYAMGAAPSFSMQDGARHCLSHNMLLTEQEADELRTMAARLWLDAGTGIHNPDAIEGLADSVDEIMRLNIGETGTSLAFLGGLTAMAAGATVYTVYKDELIGPAGHMFKLIEDYKQ
jgi:hypothetical protein